MSDAPVASADSPVASAGARRRSPEWAPLTAGTLAGVRALPAATRFIFRGGPEAMLAAGGAFGVELPQMACRAAASGTRAALWLGPDEQLLLAAEQEGAACQSALAAALASVAHSMVDVSHRQVAFEVHGAQAESLLNSGCPLDLCREAFPVDRCTRTVYAKTEIVLWRRSPEVFHVEVWRSFAEYLVGMWAEAAEG